MGMSDESDAFDEPLGGLGGCRNVVNKTESVIPLQTVSKSSLST